MDVSVRHLKAHLSEILKRAEAGESIRVTDRGRPKAILSPIPRQSLLQSAVAEGWMRAPLHFPCERVQRSPANRSVESVVDEDRGE